MIRFASVHVSADDLRFEFIRASGPGGQNVNKVATAAQLRFDVRGGGEIPDEIRSRLLQIAANRISAEGILVIDARRFRSQERNKQDAIERLRALLLQAATPPKPRKATRPTKGSVERRLEAKQQRGALKKRRGRSDDSF